MNTADALEKVRVHSDQGSLDSHSAETICHWLSDDEFADHRADLLAAIEQQNWPALQDAFRDVIPFGTGGRRGRMFPVGTNVINIRTMGESAQGLANYASRAAAGNGKTLSCAIAYDTRHRSEEFARLSAEIMVAAGLQVFFFDGHRSTPELSFAVRHCDCTCGIMITASHNPPSDNGFKAYWQSGGQVIPPHDVEIVKEVAAIRTIERIPFEQGLQDGKIIYCQDELDPAYVQAAASCGFDGPRDLKILYTPLHGVGATAVMPVLAADRFTDVEVFEPHAEANGDFPHVPEHVANPENPSVFAAPTAYATETGADLVLASDPDCDRIGAAALRTTENGTEWVTFTGNQLAALLTEYVLDRRRHAQQLSEQHYVVKTLVTTELVRRIADSYGVTTHGNLPVGFKWIGDLIERLGDETFLFGAEESHGYLVGGYARDKDGAVAAMLLAELAATLKSAGQTLHDKLEALYWQYGAHRERTVSLTLPGAEGMRKMEDLMSRFRTAPPEELAGLQVTRIRDYESQTERTASGTSEPLDGPKTNMVVLELAAEGTSVAVRPSGTEPKVKFYLFAYQPPEQIAMLDASLTELEQRLDRIEAELRQLADV